MNDEIRQALENAKTKEEFNHIVSGNELSDEDLKDVNGGLASTFDGAVPANSVLKTNQCLKSPEEDDTSNLKGMIR